MKKLILVLLIATHKLNAITNILETLDALAIIGNSPTQYINISTQMETYCRQQRKKYSKNTCIIGTKFLKSITPKANSNDSIKALFVVWGCFRSDFITIYRRSTIVIQTTNLPELLYCT